MEVERNNSENHEAMEVEDSPVAKKDKKMNDKESEQLCNGQDPSEDENSQETLRKVNGKKEDEKGESNGIKDSEDENSKDKSDSENGKDSKDNNTEDSNDSTSKDKDPDDSKEKTNANSKEDSESDTKDNAADAEDKGKTENDKDEESESKVEKEEKEKTESKDEEKKTNGEKEDKEEVKDEKEVKEEKEKTAEELAKEEEEKKKNEEKQEEDKKKEAEDKKLEAKREKVKMFDHLGKDTEDMRPMAGLLYSIGADLAKQHIFKDLLRVQTKKKAKNLFQGQEDEEQLDHLKKSLDELVDSNKRFTSNQEVCNRCQFRTESENVMEWHLEFAHGTENNIYQCCFCEHYSKYPGDFFFHVEKEHKRKGRIYMKPAFFACPLCPFEHNSKAALTKHKPKCEKNFNLKRNLEPSPTDCDIPLKKLKQLNPKVVKTPTPAKPVLPKPTPAAPTTGNWQARSASVGSAAVRMPVTVQSVFGGQLPMPQMPVLQQRPIQPVVSQYTIGNNVFTLVNSQGQFMLHQAGQQGTNVRSPMVAPTNLATAGNMVRLQVPVAQTSAANQSKSLLNAQSKNLIANQAAAQAAAAVAAATKPAVKPSNKKGNQQSGGNKSGQFEICEICGGFVKDRESLRIHFYWAHKVDINKDLFDRKTPHLICEYCPQRFWTYQGYTRHRQMSHKVTSKDPVWKCPVCREDNISNLLTHLNQKHNISLNMICHQKYCPMCGLTFKNEVATKQHLFTAHKQMFEKAVAASLKSPGKNNAASSSNNPVPTGLFKHAAKTYEPVCSICDMTFPTVESFSMHCAKMHVFKCYRCGQKWNTTELLQAHFRQAHGNEQEKCQLCSSKLTIGRPYIRHLKRTHLKECSLVLVRMAPKKFDHYYKKYLEKAGLNKAKTTTGAIKGVKNIAVARKKTSGRAEPVVIDLSDDESKKEKKKSIPAKEGKEGKGDEKVADDESNSKDANASKNDSKSSEELEDSMTMEIDGETIVIQKEDDEESDDDDKEEGDKQGDNKDDDKDSGDKETQEKPAEESAKESEKSTEKAETNHKDSEDETKDNSESSDKAINEKSDDSNTKDTAQSEGDNDKAQPEAKDEENMETDAD